MDNKVYFQILNSLKEYNKSLNENYGAEIYSLPPKLDKTKTLNFPIAIFHQVGNAQNPSFNSPFDRVSSVRYVIDIYAKNKGEKILRNEIALDLSEKFDAFLSNSCNLLRQSTNEFDLEGEGTIYRVTMTYSGNLHENRRKFI